MTDSYQHTLTQAQAAINAGEKDHALQLLKEAVEQNSADPRAWLLMVYAAPSKQLALEYLERSKQCGAKILYYSQAKRWIEHFYDPTLLEEVPPIPGLADRIRENLDRSPGLVALVYLALLAQAEATIVARDPRIGMVIHGVILAILLIHATLFSKKRSQPFLLSLALTPLIRLISLTLPLNAFPLVYWYAVVGAPLFLATYLMIRTTSLTNRQIGLTTKAIPRQIIIGLAGILLGYLEYLILRPQPLVDQFSFEAIMLPALILLIFTGFLEELIFRGLLQYSANKFIGRWGILYVAFVFAIFHFGYQSYEDFFFVLIVSLLFSYVVQKTGSILGVTLAHGLTNIFLYLIFPFIIA